MSHQTPTQAELPAEARDRIAAIRPSDLHDYVETAVVQYQEALTTDTVALPTATYIVGSVLSEDFTPGESDIDIVVAVDREPAVDVVENFWRYWNDGYARHPDLKQIDVEYTKIDVCDVFHNDQLPERLDTPQCNIFG